MRSQHGDAQQVVAHAVRQLGQRVGRYRRNQHQVGCMAQTNVGDMPFAAPQISIGVGLSPGDRLKRERRNEFRRAFGQHHIDQRAGLRQFRSQIGGFVSGNGSGDAQ